MIKAISGWFKQLLYYTKLRDDASVVEEIFLRMVEIHCDLFHKEGEIRRDRARDALAKVMLQTMTENYKDDELEEILNRNLLFRIILTSVATELETQEPKMIPRLREIYNQTTIKEIIVFRFIRDYLFDRNNKLFIDKTKEAACPIDFYETA